MYILKEFRWFIFNAGGLKWFKLIWSFLAPDMNISKSRSTFWGNFQTLLKNVDEKIDG